MKAPVKPPIAFDDRVGYAIKTLAEGKATDIQQKQILDWLIRVACRTYEDEFDPESPTLTAYMLGRRSIGQAVANIISMSPARLAKIAKLKPQPET